MRTPQEPRILAADRLMKGVIITFDDGQCAVFSASLLHAALPQAELLPDDPDDSTHKEDDPEHNR